MRCSKNAAFKMTDAWRDQPHVRLRGQCSHRRGSVVALAAAMMVMLLAMVAFAVDVGVITNARTELQRSADACAMAAIMYLPDEAAALDAAQAIAAQNPSGGAANLSISDIEFGHWDRDAAHFLTTTTSAHGLNSVRVTVRRTDDSGNPVILFFAVLLGRTKTDVTATATTMYDRDLCGPLIGIDWVSVPGTPNTDSYDSEQGGYNPATAGDRAGLCSDGPINIEGSAVVRGSARAGMGHDVTITGGAVVTGSIGSRLRPLNLPLVDASGAAALNDNSKLPLIQKGNNFVSVVDANGNFLLDGNKTYTMPPGIYYFNNFTLEGQSILNITGETIIYITGDLRRAGGVTVNNNTKVADNLQFLMTGGTADITSNNDFYGVIYATNTNITLDGSADMFGGVVGKTLTMTGGGEAHYDESLGVEGIEFPRRTAVVD